MSKERVSKSNVDFLDVPYIPFEIICRNLDMLDLRNLKQTCSEMARFVRMYIVNNAYKSKFIKIQEQRLERRRRKIENEIAQVCSERDHLSMLGRFEGKRPDMMVATDYDLQEQPKRTRNSFRYGVGVFSWVNLETLLRRKYYVNHLCMKIRLLPFNVLFIGRNLANDETPYGWGVEYLMDIKQILEANGWYQTRLKPQERRNNRIIMAFTTDKLKHRPRWDGCEVCGDLFHTKFECDEAVCSLCSQTGHLSDYCPTAECSVCGEKGHTSKICKHRWCTYCNRKGHTRKECRKLKKAPKKIKRRTRF